jgi:N-glycosidase YbiA
LTIYFYKVNEPFGCFSNFSPHPIHCFGLDWPTVEHFYQAHKFWGSPDQPIMEVIRKVATPEEAAAIGRHSDRILRTDWETAKQEIMWMGVFTKFTTYQDLQEVLLATDEELLVENSPRDYYWGCGKDGTGRNELGKLLMRLRKLLRNS